MNSNGIYGNKSPYVDYQSNPYVDYRSKLYSSEIISIDDDVNLENIYNQNAKLEDARSNKNDPTIKMEGSRFDKNELHVKDNVSSSSNESNPSIHLPVKKRPLVESSTDKENILDESLKKRRLSNEKSNQFYLEHQKERIRELEEKVAILKQANLTIRNLEYKERLLQQELKNLKTDLVNVKDGFQTTIRANYKLKSQIVQQEEKIQNAYLALFEPTYIEKFYTYENDADYDFSNF